MGPTDPARTVVERPPPGPARGIQPAPAWVVAGLGALIAILALAILARRWLGRRER